MSTVVSADQPLEVMRVLPIFVEVVIADRERLGLMLYLDSHWGSPPALHAYPLSISIDLAPDPSSFHVLGCSPANSIQVVDITCYLIAVRELHSFQPLQPLHHLKITHLIQLVGHSLAPQSLVLLLCELVDPEASLCRDQKADWLRWLGS